ncbi:MAG: hypothetical protein A2X12_03525 [Bacteroidetes bacterium GWE2_29_8]|nr:MAG: hypothetical protein A2X12_03525 [Bacteroidetes bacterium GWE2_29_8]OFY16437.1 MAG: hypothetical protein A2X02_02740 [Bacteroidetes bacterium GWF2_29_10]
MSIGLAIACIYLYAKLSDAKETVKKEIIVREVVVSEKNDLLEQLSSLQTQYDSLGQQYNGLDSLFNVEKERIAKITKELKKSKGNTAKYKKQIELLQERQNEYIKKIEELMAKNEQLTSENIIIKTDLDSALKANENLINQTQELSSKIENSSSLKAYEIVAEAIKESKNDNEMEVTNKAKRVGKIRTCLVIAENKLTEKGTINVYFRISDPNGVVMIDNVEPSHSITIDGKRMYYSQKNEVYYNNINTNVCSVWKNTKKLISGTYTVEIYTDNSKLGQTTFLLK